MIIQDKEKYFDYIKKIEKNVNNLYKSMNLNAVSETQRKEIEGVRSKIFGKLVVINAKLDAGDIITTTWWQQYTKQIDTLFQEMSDKVNQVIAYSSYTKESTR